MKLPPIIERELSRAARRKATYWLRTGSVGALLLLFLLASGIRTPKGYEGIMVFDVLSVAVLLVCMFWGLILTADSISAETEEGTLGLLFLTDLRGFDIVLGKLVANSINAFFVLLAVLPVLALPFFMGGLTGAQYANTLLLFGSTMFLSLCLGLAYSSACRDSKKSLALSFLSMVVFAGILPLLWTLQKATIDVSWLDFLLWFCPFYAFGQGLIANFPFGGITSEFWRYLECVWGVSIVCLAVASYLTSRAWRTIDAGNIPSTAKTAKSRLRPAPRVDVKNPYYFVAERYRGPSRAANWFVGIWTGINLAILFSGTDTDDRIEIAVVTLAGMHILLKFLLTFESASRLNHDRSSGALELLLTTPLPPRSIFLALRRAHYHHFGRALGVLAFLNFASMIVSICYMELNNAELSVEVLFSEFYIGGIVLLFLDFNALSWLGMWRGLTRRRARGAIIGSLLQILVSCWAVGFVIIVIMGYGGTQGVAIVAAGFYFLISGVVAFVSGAVSKESLLRDFRKTVSEGFDPPAKNAG